MGISLKLREPFLSLALREITLREHLEQSIPPNGLFGVRLDIGSFLILDGNPLGLP